LAKMRAVFSPSNPNRIYAKIKKVGQGASRNVYIEKTLTNGNKVAIMQMNLKVQSLKELIVNEILVMKESQYPNIFSFLDSFIVKDDQLWVLMEYMGGDTLTDVIDNNLMLEDHIFSIYFEVKLSPTNTFIFISFSPTLDLTTLVEDLLNNTYYHLR
ncbi:hypothetical protein BY996DRAFT_4590160, partial [Phakopsora pachyrhizi]